MSTYNGDSDSDIILYEHTDDWTGEKSYSIGYADPNYCIALMFGVCSRDSINERIRRFQFNVVKTVTRHYTSQPPISD